jgi:hypothetical protein
METVMQTKRSGFFVLLFAVLSMAATAQPAWAAARPFSFEYSAASSN